MLQIACVDDNELQREIIQELLQEYANNRKEAVNISTYSSGHELLDAIKIKGDFDIYFLDIIMPLMSGMDLAEKLREQNVDGEIVFLTSSEDYVFDAFRIHAYQYVMKPINREKLFSIIDEVLKAKKDKNPTTITVKTKAGPHRIRLDDIQYVTRESRCLVYHLNNGASIMTTSMRTTSSEMFAPLLEDKRFFMAGVSLTINMSEILSLEKGHVVLKNGEHLYPPERSYVAMKKAYNNF